ncbi:hypothetical protein [Nocardia niwae]|uniref:hypothetical protein n=1 Tax=Nocardia niwae TaxID=626084 RepID=UPI0033D7A574
MTVRKLLQALRTHLRLLWVSLRDAIPLFFSLIRRFCELLCRLHRRRTLPDRERRRSRDRCVPINEPAYKRPDPLIYSQYYLMRLGLAVTWDNPDIQLYRNGTPVPSSALEADTEYDIVARVWNNSTEAPIVGMPVRFSYLSFGVGTQAHSIGETAVDLGVKGGPNHPAFARTQWRTPVTTGHYCLQVQLDWRDDANPANNLGQENTNVARPHSPAEFAFALRNPTHEQLEYRFEIDTYDLPLRPPCPAWSTSAERERYMRATHQRENFPLPDGWAIELIPSAPVVAAEAEVTVRVVATAPDGFRGRQTINVHAFNRYGLAGGVTLRVEGA